MYKSEYQPMDYEELILGLEYLLEEHQEINSCFTIEENLLLASMCCITQSDHVLIATTEIVILSLIIPYLYLPSVLMIMNNRMDTFPYLYQYQNHFIRSLNLISKFPYTLLSSVSHISEIKNNFFDVILSSYHTNLSLLKVEHNNRFDMLLGEEYTSFSNNLFESSKRLFTKGKLIILARACWILTIWQKLEQYKLLLEYPEYHYYLQPDSNPNRFVWLRFSYQEEGIDSERQKRNLLLFMRDNNMDRLYAHRNNYLFPYAELVKVNEKAYVNLGQNLENLQYFFTDNTTRELTELCFGYTACLVVPSIALCANDLNKNIVLFEMDNRFRSNGTLKFVKYDLNKGLNPLTWRKYGKKFDTVICDPPFNINLSLLAKNIYELVLDSKDSKIYIIYPRNRRNLLVNSMKVKGMYLYQNGSICIEYAKPPKLVRMEGNDAIQLYEFRLT